MGDGGGQLIFLFSVISPLFSLFFYRCKNDWNPSRPHYHGPPERGLRSSSNDWNMICIKANNLPSQVHQISENLWWRKEEISPKCNCFWCLWPWKTLRAALSWKVYRQTAWSLQQTFLEKTPTAGDVRCFPLLFHLFGVCFSLICQLQQMKKGCFLWKSWKSLMPGIRVPQRPVQQRLCLNNQGFVFPVC